MSMARTLALRSSVIFVTVGAVVEVVVVEREERGREGVGCCSLRTIACVTRSDNARKPLIKTWYKVWLGL